MDAQKPPFTKQSSPLFFLKRWRLSSRCSRWLVCLGCLGRSADSLQIGLTQCQTNACEGALARRSPGAPHDPTRRRCSSHVARHRAGTPRQECVFPVPQRESPYRLIASPCPTPGARGYLSSSLRVFAQGRGRSARADLACRRVPRAR